MNWVVFQGNIGRCLLVIWRPFPQEGGIKCFYLEGCKSVTLEFREKLWEKITVNML